MNLKKIIIISLIIVMMAGVASAETGNISVTQYINKNNYIVGGTGAILVGPDYTKITINNNDYNTFDYLNATSSHWDFLHDSESTPFIFISGSTPLGAGGYVTMTKATKTITWYFDTITLTSNQLVLSYTKNIFANISHGATSGYPTPGIGVNTPAAIGIQGYNGGAIYSVSPGYIYYSFSGGVQTTNQYNVTYPTSNSFNIVVTKGTIATWVYVHSTTLEYIADSNFNSVPLSHTDRYKDGLYLNVTLAAGAYKDVLINSTDSGYMLVEEIVVDPVTGVGIMVTPTSGYRGTVFNISWLRTKPTPFGYIDSIRIYESGITEPVHILWSPPDSGYTKNTFTVARYTVKFQRTFVLDFGMQTLASASFEVSPVPPSYILVDTKYYVNQSKNVTYFIGDPLASIQDYYYNSETKKYESKGGWWGYTTGIESNWSYKCLYPAKMKFAIILLGVNWSDAPTELSTVYSECVTDTNKPEYDILNSYLSIVPGSTNLLEYVDISYAVPSVDWVGNISYLRNYYNGNVIWSHIIDRQMYYNMSYFVRPTPGSYYHMTVGTGLNTIKLETSTGTVLNTSTLTISATDTEGYGLEFDKLLFCSGEVIKFKYYSPDAVNFSIWDDNGKLVYLKKLNASFEGKVMEINFKKIGVFDVRLLDPNALQKMNRVITIDSCIGVVDPKQYGGATNATCGFWDNCVSGMFPGQGLNNVTRLLFALFCIVVMMFFGMVVSKGNFGVSVILGFLPYAFFTYLTLSSPCGEYMPVWISIFVALIVGIKMKWFS